MPTTPTQVQRPWRATVRTVFAAVVGFAAMWGLIVETIGLNPEWQWVSVSLLVTGAITRLMAVPQVEEFLAQFVPWLAADPDTTRTRSAYVGKRRQGEQGGVDRHLVAAIVLGGVLVWLLIQIIELVTHG